MSVEDKIKLQLGEMMVQILSLQNEIETKDAIINKLQESIEDSVKNKKS